MIKKICADIKTFSRRLFDRLYELDNLREKNETKVLHISDTPDNIYRFIYSVIDRLEPDYLIHTGDLADNIKLANGAPRDQYKKSVDSFINELNKRDRIKKIIVPGNHDNEDLLRNFSDDGIEIMEEGSSLKIEGVSIGMSHYKEKLPDHTEINLFGHEKTTINNNKKVYLNGLVNVNIILLPSVEIHKLSYPIQTDSGRQYKRLKLP